MAAFTRRWARHHFRRRAQITISTPSGIDHGKTATWAKAVRYVQRAPHSHGKVKGRFKRRPAAT